MVKNSGKGGKRGEVKIKESCRACGICVEFCERGVLAMDASGKVKVVKPEGCTACRLCELRCPDLCVFVTAGGV